MLLWILGNLYTVYPYVFHAVVCSIVWFFSPFISLMYQLITDLQYKTYHSSQSNTWQTDTIKLYFYKSYSFVLCLGKTEDENMLWIAHRHVDCGHTCQALNQNLKIYYGTKIIYACFIIFALAHCYCLRIISFCSCSIHAQLRSLLNQLVSTMILVHL